MHYLGALGQGVEWVYVILEGQASERAPYPGSGTHKGSQDLVLKPGKRQSSAEQTSGSFSQGQGRGARHTAWDSGTPWLSPWQSLFSKVEAAGGVFPKETPVL